MDGKSNAGKKGNKLLLLVILTVTLFIVLQCLAFENRWHALDGALHRSSTRAPQFSIGELRLRESLRRAALCVPSAFSSEQGFTLPSEEVDCLKEVILSSLENDTVLQELVQRQDIVSEEATGDQEQVNSREAEHLAAVEHLEQDDEAQEDEQIDAREVVELKSKLKLAEDRLAHSVTMKELKDLSQPGLTHAETNWFMSSLRGKPQDGRPEQFRFPSDLSQGKLLCLQGNNTSNGTKNSYGFAWKEYLPLNATLLPGVTLIADNYWDYVNPWHSMTAVINFAVWRADNGCQIPERLVNYHWGEVVPRMGDWITNILHASLGKRFQPETFNSYGTAGPFCFEDAIVHRRGVGGMSRVTLNRMFDMVRCNVYMFCKLAPKSYFLDNKQGKIDLTVVARTGAREFTNLSGLVHTVSEQCKLVQGCQLNVVSISNMTFCEQVEVMSKTDILLTSHGAQLTNMMFMPKNGSVMELFPKGWLELAGVGQYIYSWLTDWTGLFHEGTWRDPEGPDCPYNSTESAKCFIFFKDRPVGLNETHLSTWTADVLQKVQLRKKNNQGAAAAEVDDATPAWDADCTCLGDNNADAS